MYESVTVFNCIDYNYQMKTLLKSKFLKGIKKWTAFEQGEFDKLVMV